MPASTNYPIGSHQNIGRNCDDNLFRRLKIKNEFEFHRLLYWNIGGFGAFEDFVHVRSRAPRQVSRARSIDGKPTRLYELFSPKDHRKATFYRQFRNARPLGEENGGRPS
jgi:hypothetical protein